MDTLHIHRMTARYHLPGPAREEHSRLDRVLRQVLDEVLEAALERAGIPTHEEICVRELHVPVRLRMSSPDASLAVEWSLAVAGALQSALMSGKGVVHYGSRHHALVDVALGATRGELSRAWAWRQLGLWRQAGTPSDTEAVREAVRALMAEPRAIVPTVMELARANALPRFVTQAGAEGCTALARAALTGFSAPVVLAAGTHPEERAPACAPELAHRATRVLGASAIARAIAQGGAGGAGAAGPLRALSVLSVLEAEPTAFRQGPRLGAALLVEVERRLRASFTTPSGESHSSGDVLRQEEGKGTPRAPGPGDTLPASAEPHASEPRPEDGSTREGVLLRTEQPPLQEGNPARGPEARETPGEATTVPEVRHRATTRAAGLLFLLHLVDELELPDTLLAHEAATSRGLRWLLHRLALTLQPLEPGDPAVLGFAGLPPDALPPSEGEPPPTGAERELLEACATRVLERLRERLNRPDEPRERLLLSVCRRRGEVVADPGWLEVRLPLDEVSTEVRRAGLDLHPDWLPWLGAVVRFSYA